MCETADGRPAKKTFTNLAGTAGRIDLPISDAECSAAVQQVRQESKRLGLWPPIPVTPLNHRTQTPVFVVDEVSAGKPGIVGVPQRAQHDPGAQGVRNHVIKTTPPPGGRGYVCPVSPRHAGHNRRRCRSRTLRHFAARAAAMATHWAEHERSQYVSSPLDGD